MPAPTLFLRDFTVLDCALLDGQLGPVGESLYVSAELEGELDEKGFLFDFGPAKKTLKRVVDEEMDHRLVVPAGLAVIRGGIATLAGGAGLRYECPEEGLAVVPGSPTDLRVLEAFLNERCLANLPRNLNAVRIELRAEPRFEREASFRYTHGLRLHDGNCQRLYHGHRNPIEVWREGRRDESLERWLAAEWDNVHFAHRDTIRNFAALDLSRGRRNHRHPGVAELEYTSPQGRFRGHLNASRLAVLDTEPSIENIARLGYELLRTEGVTGPLHVVAYEGLNKGARYGA